MAKRRQVRDVITISYARDKLGRYWWKEDTDPKAHWHGPFRSDAEAQADSESVALEPGVPIKDGDSIMLPAVKRKQ